MDKAVEVMKPGIEAEQVHKAVKGELDMRGYSALQIHRTGYSIGLGFAPSWNEGDILSLRGGEHTKLQPGMTFHIVGATVKIPGEVILSAGSETIIITEDGNEVLSKIPRKVFVK